MSISLHTAGAPTAAINMTPMIDVLLVLIIIFMVITPLAPKGLDTQIAHKPESASTAPAGDIVVTVHDGGRVLLNHESLDVAALYDRLALLFRRGAKPVVFVRGAKELEFREIAAVIDVAKGAGAARIGLMTR